jgi:transcriptional regulator with XRE-family HTH domain
MATYRKFGALVRGARIRANLHGDEVARAIGIGATHYGRIEYGYTLVSLTPLALLRDFLHIDANELLAALHCESAPLTIMSETQLPSERTRIWGKYGPFGRLILEARRQRQWTTEQVAQSIGCRMAQYYRLENGNSLPRLKTFARLWHCLGFDANRLLEAVSKPGRFFWIGAFIADARTRSAMTPIEVADLVGCTVEQYQLIEQGAELPTLTTFVRLHRVLKFDLRRALRLIHRAGMSAGQDEPGSAARSGAQ